MPQRRGTGRPHHQRGRRWRTRPDQPRCHLHPAPRHQEQGRGSTRTSETTTRATRPRETPRTAMSASCVRNVETTDVNTSSLRIEMLVVLLIRFGLVLILSDPNLANL